MNKFNYQDLEANFGPAEGSGSELYDAVGRTIDHTGQSLKTRYERVEDAWTDPNISAAEATAHTVGQTAGAALDVVGGVAGTALDAVIPGTPVQDLGEKLMATPAGQYVLERWGQLTPEDQRRVSTGLMPIEVLATRLGLRAPEAVGMNMRTHIKDFYTSAKVPQALLEMTRGAARATKNAVSPHAQALYSSGLSPVFVDEITDIAGILRNHKEITRKLDAGEALTPEERKIYKHMLDMGKSDGEGGRTPVTLSTAKSYIEGAAMTRLHLAKQAGKDTDLLEALILNPSASAISRAGDPNFALNLGQLPPAMRERFAGHVRAQHKLPDDGIVIHRAGTQEGGGVNLVGEAVGQQGSPHGRLASAYREKGGGHLLKALDGDPLDGPEELAMFLRASNLSTKDQANYIKYNRMAENGTLTNKKQIEAFERIKADVQANPGPMLLGKDPNTRWDQSGPDADGYYYFDSGHHSADKALGGVDTFVAVNPDTGEVVSMISDGSDLFGQVPPGNKQLVTVVQPVQYNMYDTVKKGKTKPLGQPAKTTRAEAVTEGERITGVKRSEQNLPGASMWETYIADVAEQYKPKPSLRDYGRAAGNTAAIPLAAAGGGMLSSHLYQGDNE